MGYPLPYRISKLFTRFWSGLRKLSGIERFFPPTVHAYRGFGTEHYLFLRGRVLHEKTIIRAEGDTNWHNFIKTVKRFNSWEIEKARVRISFQEHVFELTTDSEGYFTLDTRFDKPLPFLPQEEPFWQEAKIELLSIPSQPVNKSFHADIILPDKNSDFGVISDIDDTVLQTYVTSWLKWRVIYLTLLHNAISRQAFEQVANFFQALRRGPLGQSYNPFFYVSNSPWNLYDLLQEFLSHNKLPRGPIMLRDFGLKYEQLPKDYKGHKHEQIISILKLYPKLAFVLIGDSGEKDADIYKAVHLAFPNRVRAIYIRDVGSKSRANRVQQVLSSIKDIPCLLVKDYQQAIAHAKGIELIALN